jgi:very-short-patch-repair endonuclease
VDFVWRDHGLVIKVDGRAVHRTVRAFEQDPRTDNELRLLGWSVARFTHAPVTRDPIYVTETTERLLARKESPPLLRISAP